MILSMTGDTVEAASQGILPAAAGLARSADPEAALAGLSIFEAVLRALPETGAKMVEAVDGIEILEVQQMG